MSIRRPYVGASQAKGGQDIQTVRIPIIGDMLFRGTSGGKDQRFINGYFDVFQNPETQKTHYFFQKRPGLTQTGGLQPTGGAATARRFHSWNSKIYSVFNNKIYSNTTDLGVTLPASTGCCDFAETRPGATTQYLGVNDGTNLYLIATDDSVIVLNNKAITSSSVNNPTVITATAHGLNTGNKIIIRNHTGSTPSINDTIYTITKTGVDTFTIPVNVTVGGTGGTIGVFPSPNTDDLIYMDGYWFVLKQTDGTVWGCEIDDPTTWTPSKFLTAQMYEGSGIGLARQNNLLVVFMDKHTQFFYDAANTTGLPLSNVEQYVQQLGCVAEDSIVHDEGSLFWISQSLSGGYSVYRLEGVTSLKDVATPAIQRLLTAEGTNIANARALSLRISGHFFYVLHLALANRTFVFDHKTELWTEWQGTDGAKFPAFHACPHNNVLLVQHFTNGWIYALDQATYQDDSLNFSVIARLARMDFESTRWKYCKRFDLIGDSQVSNLFTDTTGNILVQYSDDDYTTVSTARTLSIALGQCYCVNLGRFQRRAWQVTQFDNSPFRIEAIELRLRMGDS